MKSGAGIQAGKFGRFGGLTDYILGITHEIWESRQLDRIRDYYSGDCRVYALGGLVCGVQAIIDNTADTLRAFPDRLLLGETVIGSQLAPGKWLSSHRIGSPMTHRGDLPLVAATGRKVFVRTIADCVVEGGEITLEWLVRDNYSLMQQLGVDPLEAARRAAQAAGPELRYWLQSERERLTAGRPDAGAVAFDAGNAAGFVAAQLANSWIAGNQRTSLAQYAAYAVLHDSAPVASGVAGILAHQQQLRSAMSDVALSVDHVGIQSRQGGEHEIAARWVLRFRHGGELWGLAPTGRTAVLLGISHYHVVAGRIAAEWTIYDRVALLAQLLAVD